LAVPETQSAFHPLAQSLHALRLTALCDYAKFFSRPRHAVIRVYDAAGNVIETHDQKGDFKEP